MVSNLLEADTETVLDAAFAGGDEELFVVDPAEETISSLIEVAVNREGLPKLSLLVDKRTVKGVMDDFLVASKIADLVANGSLDLRLLPTAVDNALFVSQSRVVVLVSTDDRITALSTEDDDFVSEVFETNRAAFETAETYGLRTPALSRVRETMAAEIGEDTRDDFDAMLSAMGSTHNDDSRLDEVTISLLVAAKNDVLLYDISKWGEDVGIASKATFSRTKTRLEDLGIIDTEKVPIDVGRPRLRLKLGDERLHGVEAEDLADVALDLLS